MINISRRTIGEMKEVAYRPQEVSLPDEELAYIMIRNPGRNLTIFPFYRLGGGPARNASPARKDSVSGGRSEAGGEYPKTYGHFHVPDCAETYQVLKGTAGFLLQQVEGEQILQIKFKVVEEGQTFTVPSGWGHVAVNLGSDYLITLDDYDPARFENDYSLVKKMRGFGYYLVEKEGTWQAVPNPSYTQLPALTAE
ncbi:MAG: glucose-6-phosphate isomerase family protein [candidate division WWE3 bacterium]|nr:glucose-6-phosphate isomerase family protein [candidate division WWE3 bacterium]